MSTGEQPRAKEATSEGDRASPRSAADPPGHRGLVWIGMETVADANVAESYGHERGALEHLLVAALGAGRVGNARLELRGRWLVAEGLVFEKALGKCIVAFRGAENCRMTDCAFVDCGDPQSTFSHIITLREGSRSNLIDHCSMAGNLSMGMGVIVAESDDRNTGNRFTHNYYRDVVRRRHNGQEAIQIGQSTFSRNRSVRAGSNCVPAHRLSSVMAT